NGTTAGAISYRIVDMSLDGTATSPAPPAGEVTTAVNTTVAGLSSSEAMMVVAHPDGDGLWLITHTSGSAQYAVTRFTDSGPGTPVTFNLGLITSAANFSYHPQTGKIAISPFEANRNVEILNFDPATGTLT